MKTLALLFALALASCLSAYAQPHPSVTLTWSWAQGSGDPATGFHVQRGTAAGGPYTVVGTVPVGTLTFLDTSVAVGASYFYVVTSYNPGGESAKSNEIACAIPFLPSGPAPPTSLSGTSK